MESILIFVASYLWHGFGITVGYHRLLAHRSFRCGKALEYILILGGYLAFQGSPIWWASVHRVHHKNADTEQDIHSPRSGKLHAYAGWMADDVDIPVETVSADLCKDPIYRFLDSIDERYKLFVSLAFRVVIGLMFGWKIAVINLAAAFCVLQIPLLLNLFCHLPKLGYKNFKSADDAVNVWWVALLALGEGWHNNHHVHPGSPRMGLGRWEFDLSWHLIQLLSSLGLVNRLNPQPVLNSAASAAIRPQSLKTYRSIPLSAGPDVVCPIRLRSCRPITASGDSTLTLVHSSRRRLVATRRMKIRQRF